LQKKYRNLWVFGDSYSTPNICVDPNDSFWMLTARELQVDKIYNYSWPRNSLDSVVHLLISDSNEYDWNQDFFLIGIPILTRLTVVSDNSEKSYHRKIFDLTSNEIDQQMILCHHGLENLQFVDDSFGVRFEDPTWTEIQACRLIYLVNTWLDAHNANYLIVNLSKDFQNDQPATGKFLLDKCLNHPNNILIGDTYWGINYGVNKPADYDKYKWAGHHGAPGNKYYFEKSLKPRLKKLNLC
jgi:hypothetical protein